MLFQGEDKKRAGRGNACLETIGKDDKERQSCKSRRNQGQKGLTAPVLNYIKSKQYCTKKMESEYGSEKYSIGNTKKIKWERLTFVVESVVQWLKKNSMTFIN